MPEAHADIVMRKLAKARVGDRKVVVDFADREPQAVGAGTHKERRRRAVDASAVEGRKGGKPHRKEQPEFVPMKKKARKADDWKQFFED